MFQQFARSEVSKLLGISEHRLRYWDKLGLVKPSLKEGRRVYYDFKDLICLRTTLGLVEKGLSPNRIKQSIDSLRRRFPEADAQLSNKRIYVFGNRVIISHRNRLIDSRSGQLLLKFDVDSFASEVNESVEDFEAPKGPDEWFREGLSLDSNPETYDRALHAYRQAVKQRPDFAAAYVNMGTVYFNQKKLIDAQRAFRMAIQQDPYNAKAAFNLANVLDDLNCTDEAVQWYERSIEADPNFPDVYFNLAAVSEKLGQLDRAVRNWKAYLSFDSESRHAGVARKRIKLLESHFARQ